MEAILNWMSIKVYLTISKTDFRFCDIKMLQKITKNEWQILNYVIEPFIKSNCILMDLWNINVIQYRAILAILEKSISL